MNVPDAASNDLADVLRSEARALLLGDFAALGSLSAARTSALDRLEPGADLTLIRRLAARNLRLAEAALAGVGAAQNQLRKAIAGASFDTYEADGRLRKYSDARPKLHRRA